MSKDKKKDVFDELVNNPTFIKEADDAWKNIDKLPSFCLHCNCMTKTIKSLCGKCGGSKKNTPYIEEFEALVGVCLHHIRLYEKSKDSTWSEPTDFKYEAKNDKEALEKIVSCFTKIIESERERAIEDFITKMFGKRCKEYEEGCPVCDEWKLFDEYIK